MTVAMPEPYWTPEVRCLFARHLTESMRGLVSDPDIKFVLLIIPECNFLTHPDQKVAAYMWSVQENGSVWIRETLSGKPLPYRLYVDHAITAVARLIPYEHFLDEPLGAVVEQAVQSEADPRLPDHPWRPREIRMRTNAIERHILQDNPPAEVAELFAQAARHTQVD
jgi:hypothetical protein